MINDVKLLLRNKFIMTRKKILIADDEPDILEIIQFNLQAEGYEWLLPKTGMKP